MFKWIKNLLGLNKEPSFKMTQEQADKILDEALKRVSEKHRRESAVVNAVDQMVQEQRGFTTPSRPANPEPAKFNSRGVRVPTEEESRRARPVVPPPPPPPRPVVRSANRASNDLPPSRSSDNGSDTFLATAVALSVMDSSPSYSTPSGGYDSGCSSSSDGGGGGSCD